MDNFRAFVEQVKQANDITEVMAEIGSEYRTSSRMVHGWCIGETHDSLEANPTTGIFCWFSKDPHRGQPNYGHGRLQGDVFVFLQEFAAMDFWQALEYLAQRKSIQMPKFKREQSEVERQATQQRENLLVVATDFFEQQLWANPAALDYVRSRGWNDETIRVKTQDTQGKVIARGAALGYSGGSVTATDQLRDLLMQKGCDIHSPEAVALVGLRGGVATWCQARAIEPAAGWLDDDRIWGMTEFPRLVYPLRKFGQGQTLYFHCRNLTWEDDALRAVRKGETTQGGALKPQMHNPDKKLFGERPLFFNHAFHKNSPHIAIVEGPADAVSLAQWKYAAIALCGLGATEQLKQALIGDKTNAVKEGRVFLALDNDEAGRKARQAVCELLGEMVRVVNWRRPAALTRLAPELPKITEQTAAQPDATAPNMEENALELPNVTEQAADLDAALPTVDEETING